MWVEWLRKHNGEEIHKMEGEGNAGREENTL